VIIRSFAIILVVAFHAYYMMMVEGHFPASKEMYRSLYYNINCLILQFRMPLFLFISGYLFSHLENERGKYKTFKDLIHNKFKRLILPFFVFVTIFMVSINDFSWKPYYSWGYQHLWFIPMLFWCFIFTRIQSFLPFSKTMLWKTIVFISFFILTLNIIPRISIPLLAIPNFLKWYFWFYLGYHIYLTRDRFYGFILSHKVSVSIFLLTIFIIGSWAKCTYIINDSVRTWYTEIANLAIVILFWFWTNLIIINNLIGEKKIKFFNWLNKHSYGIYVFHNWLQPFIISSTAIGLFGLDVLAMQHPFLFPLLFFIISFLLSLALTWCLLKTRIGRFLIG